MSSTELSRRTFLIAGSTAAALATIAIQAEPATASPAIPDDGTAAVAAARPHRTLLGVL